MDLCLEGRALIGDQLVNCCIGIEGGKIVAIKKMLEAEEHMDFRDMIILPGGVDPHVHFREPGMTRKEDFSTGTRAAAHGGVTCVLDMPNTKPPTIDRGSLDNKLEKIKKKAWVDYGVFMGCVPGTDPSEPVEGAIGYKLYMGSTTGDLLVTEDEDIRRILKGVEASGKVLSVHAEDQSWLRDAPASDLEDHLMNRPYQAEVKAIERLLSMSSYPGVNICHISSRQGLDLLDGKPFTKEVTPHHLLLSTKNDLGQMGKVNPPLRNEANRKALFEAFQEGRIDVLASDHAPHTFGQKQDEFDYAPSGVPGVETSLPLMLLLVKRGIIDLPLLARTACFRPASMFDLNKGYIDVGRDADLMIVDTKRVTSIKGDRLESRCGWSPYEGWEAIFPHAVFVRGSMVVEDSELTGVRAGENVALQ